MKLDLPNNCGLIAVAASEGLSANGVENKILRYSYLEEGGGNHLIIIFKHNKRLRAYDINGSLDLSIRLSFDSTPLKIARDWASKSKEVPWPRTAEWY